MHIRYRSIDRSIDFFQIFRCCCCYSCLVANQNSLKSTTNMNQLTIHSFIRWWWLLFFSKKIWKLNERKNDWPVIISKWRIREFPINLNEQLWKKLLQMIKWRNYWMFWRLFPHQKKIRGESMQKKNYHKHIVWWLWNGKKDGFCKFLDQETLAETIGKTTTNHHNRYSIQSIWFVVVVVAQLLWLLLQNHQEKFTLKILFSLSLSLSLIDI